MKHILYTDPTGGVDMDRRGPGGRDMDKHRGPECRVCGKWWCVYCGWSYDPWLIEDCPFEGHVYLSTGCLHGNHEYCKNPERGGGGAKEPAQCKFCKSPCICSCHS